MANNSEHLVYTITIKDNGTMVIENLNKEVKNNAQLFKELNKDILKNAEAGNLSASAMSAQINQLKRLRDSTTTSNTAFRKQTEDIRILEKQYKKLTQVTQQQTDKTGLASATLVEFSRGIQDANYGFRGIANNLSQLTTLMTTLIGTTGGLKNAWDALKNAFTGPIGFLVVANIVIAALERLEIMSQKTTRETNKLNDALSEAGGLINSMERYADIARDANRTDEERTVALQRLADEGYDEATGSIDDFLDAKRKLALFNATESVFQEEEKEFLAERIKLNRQLKQAEEDVIAEQKRMSAANLTPYSDVGGNITILKDDIKRIQGLLIENQDEIDKISNEMLDSFNKTSEELKDNPFYTLLFGVKDDKSDKKEVLDFEKSVEDALAVWEEQKWLLERERLQEHYDKLIEMTRAKGESTIALETAKFAALKQMDEKRAADLKAIEEKEKEKAEREAVRQIRISQAQVRVEEEALKQHQKIAQARIGFATQVSGILQTLAGENEEMAKVGLILEKGAAIADIVIKSQQSVATQTAASAAFKLKTEAAYAGLPGGFLVAKGLIAANQMSLKKNILNTKISAGLSIAQILATSLAPKGNDIAAVSAPSESSTSAPQIQAPSFNVVGATQQSQLAQAISGQEEKPIKAFVVADDVTTTQELLRKAVEGATLG